MLFEDDPDAIGDGVSGYSRRAILRVGSMAAAALGLTGAGPTRQSRAAGQPRRGGELRLLVDPEPSVLIALTTSADPTLVVSGKVNEGLLAYDFDLSPRPQLATKWWVGSDALEYGFELRQGVKWHDGVDFTSADVAFSILTLREVHPRGRATFANVAEIRTPDPHTAVIRLSKPAPYLLTALAGSESPMVPQHRYDGFRPDTSPNANEPVGTGPFVFKEWVRGSYAVYERNPNYWDPPKPYLDRLIVRFIEDPSARLSAIVAGEIDLAPAAPVSLADLDELEKSPDLRFETNGYQYYNQVVRIEFNLDHPLLGRLKVRQAIAHAIDRKAILETAWRGRGQLSYGPIGPGLRRFYAMEPEHSTFDPRAAERLLDEAGLPRGTDGIRFSLNHDFVPAGDGFTHTAEYVARALADIGIAVTVRTTNFAGFTRRIYSERDFDLATARANNMFDPTVGVQRLYWSKNFKKGVPFSNGSHYASPDADAALEAAAVEADPARRRDYFAAFQNAVARELPDITLLAPQQITIAKPAVANHTMGADGVNGNLADAFMIPLPG
jgi:peptide/nickel transport system substrate-binding protein